MQRLSARAAVCSPLVVHNIPLITQSIALFVKRTVAWQDDNSHLENGGVVLTFNRHSSVVVKLEIIDFNSSLKLNEQFAQIVSPLLLQRAY